MAFIVKRCEAHPGSITIVYSEPVDASGIATANYSITDPNKGTGTFTPANITMIDPVTVVMLFTPEPFTVGDGIQVKIANVKSAASGALLNTTAAGMVETGERRIKEITEAVEDAVAYPLLTEPVSFGPSALGASAMPMGQPSGAPLAGVVNKALADVLGWKINASDSKGFVGALTQSFALSEFEGHTEAKWTPRSYAVQTDLAGGITGAQASLYTRAQDAQDKCVPLFDGLYPLDPEADKEDVSALRELAKSQLAEIVKELGAAGGPSVLRVDTYFQILIGTSTAPPTDADTLPDSTLKSLRDVYGLEFRNNPLSNSIEDEQDITNFRIISDYISSLLQTWVNNKTFFAVGPGTQQAFFGTQLVQISRQLSVILETVNEVRFALDSVFIGPSERQTLVVQFRDGTPAIYLEDMLSGFMNFFGEEAPRLLQDGGRLSVKNNILPVVSSFRKMADGARHPANIRSLPDGFRTVRVRRAFDDLAKQIADLEQLSTPIGRNVPPPEGGLFAFPPKVDFGTVTAGSPLTEPVTVAVANLAPTPISSLSASTTDPTSFVVTTQVDTKLDAMSTSAISVAFQPPATVPTSPPSVTLNIVADGRTIAIPLTAKVEAAGTGGGVGDAGRLVAIPPNVDFETVTIGATTPLRRTLTLMNMGGTDVSVNLSSSDPASFPVTSQAVTVPAQSAVGIDLTVYAPATASTGTRREKLTITAGAQKLEINLHAHLAHAAGTTK